ncbi:MAG: pyridoxal phosphate-dependent aminotransferase [Ignavibacteriales bacterium]|nr:pyridoxal phosphate-dependent aminotransferase [Ignavibacteriales bacterium]
MNTHARDPLSLFGLKPLKAARVSEISEATASSAAAPEDRVNFHIGNPVQDKRLTSLYLRMVLGIDILREDLSDDQTGQILQLLEWEQSDEPKLAFLRNLIQKSAPYTPRGGFARNNPNAIVKAFVDWLQTQQEPMSYDLGQTTGRREIILASGGVEESLRVLFHSLSTFLSIRPAKVFLHRARLPVDDKVYSGLTFERLPDDEQELLVKLTDHFKQFPQTPSFLILREILGEETRRSLRLISLDAPLFFLEANDAPNHLSLAREAKLVQRVIRFLTPSIFGERLKGLATVFLAGNADILSAFESLHFQLKGTPSASEIELLSYLRENGTARSKPVEPEISLEPTYHGLTRPVKPTEAFPLRARSTEVRLGAYIDEVADKLEHRFEWMTKRVEDLSTRIDQFRPSLPFDRFATMDTKAFLHELAEQIDSKEYQKELQQSLLQVFLQHHPEYRVSHSVVVSGSSRTALGFLGLHCGISEVIVADLSWSYEHCFPSILAVPLTEGYALDIDGLIEAVQAQLVANPRWNEFGAVVLNNPHNATGRVFEESGLRRLMTWLLEHAVYVIDDLSYQEVAPSSALPGIKTLRQIADDLVRSGTLSEEKTEKVITVHSVSKTDCLAGARLAVVEAREEGLFRRFIDAQRHVLPNLGAIALTYLFYRNETEVARAYWRLRNRIFLERTEALLEAVKTLPPDRNPFHIDIIPPMGSMYPLMVIHRLPFGLSLDWLASGLARQGIGMLPLSTFARTEEGFETGRKTFRLTLGGTDGADILLPKTRRVLIDLNRLIAEESSRYNRLSLGQRADSRVEDVEEQLSAERWKEVEDGIADACKTLTPQGYQELLDPQTIRSFMNEYVPERLTVFRQRWQDRFRQSEEMMRMAEADGGKALIQVLQRDLYKDSLVRRDAVFRSRNSDRTVHPTQMYSIKTEARFEEIIGCLIRSVSLPDSTFQSAARELLEEFLGLNVAITSSEESDELLLDLDAAIRTENVSWLSGGVGAKTVVSFWGDWDGSNRPSGQGHRLMATTLIANVSRLARLLWAVLGADKTIRIEANILAELRKLPESNRRFTKLLNDITDLTHQLEKRYRGVLPFSVKPGAVRNVGMKLRLARDPLTLLWQHNDRLERRMVDLRQKRRETLEYYFFLNKLLRKQLHALLAEIQENFTNRELLLEACLFRDLLQRMVITPRIDQKMITTQDSFAIDTTVHNIHEINEIAAKYGNPGVILALQVSMSTQAEALITLDRKLRASREQALRSHPQLELPTIQLIPLFEDLTAVRSIPAYLTKIWEYAHQSRRVDQESDDRFAEIISEVFIAGSDLSQQVGQAAGASLYKEAKHELMLWLAEHGLIDRIRIKMGSGEPMQRQGGYYAAVSGKRAFSTSPAALRRIKASLPPAASKSAEYATTPLMGLFTGGDLRTLQSAVTEQLRYLPVEETANVHYHLTESQRKHRSDLIRAAETLVESRLLQKKRGAQELERLTVGTKDPVYEKFLALLTEDFRQILYGREEDVVGMHIISYFIARTMPQLRDRPTVRPQRSGPGSERGHRILEQIAQIIPMSRHGSRLRAIAHNQAQTAVLGYNQLTTGLFRALDRFARLEFKEGDARSLITDRVLPQLPVYEMLQSLRLYHDPELTFVKKMELAFPGGTSAFLAVREDNDGLLKNVGLIQQELLRRHGVDVSDFFDNGRFVPELLPTLRPDLAVLLQSDLFNTDITQLLHGSDGRVEAEWRKNVEHLLRVPVDIRAWRLRILDLLERPLYQRVQSFVELALALNSLSSTHVLKSEPGSLRARKMSSELSHFFRASNATDDMHQFLGAALEYLGALSEGMMEVPVSIIRSLKEVETIAKIEEQALSPEKQQLLRFFMLQIARLAGENG